MSLPAIICFATLAFAAAAGTAYVRACGRARNPPDAASARQAIEALRQSNLKLTRGEATDLADLRREFSAVWDLGRWAALSSSDPELGKILLRSYLLFRWRLAVVRLRTKQ